MKKLTVIALAALVATAVLADTVEYTDSVSMINNTDSSINLTKFDSSLGTLTGVYIEYWTLLSGARVQMDNDASLQQDGTAQVICSINSLVSEPQIISATFNALNLGINESQIFSLDPTSGDTVGQFDATGEGDYADWNPGTLTGVSSGDILLFHDEYIGDGTYSVTINSSFLTGANFDGENGHFEGSSATGTFSGKVAYTYTAAIPEPATASLMVGILAAAAWIRRRFMD